ncbi:MAG: DNA topoisomerase IB [Methylophilus sp.]|uniref:DNA topoisomerase IB n=1 Tax=Methylophilus sp. TaxID=29541 RepID=UPI003FA0E0A4
MVSKLSKKTALQTAETHGHRLEKLHYIQDDTVGYSRQAFRGKFRYLDQHGQVLKAEKEISRIVALRIPPAWQTVWICTRANGHLQATGRDAKGRKQYLYHAEWRKQREAKKYEHMIDFGLQLPGIRAHIARDLAAPGLGKEKVLAMLIYLLENTLIRIGNDEYAKTNKSFGLTTLRNRHVDIQGSEIQFHFRGKSGVEHSLSLRDRRLARLIRNMRELPGQTLFQYVDAQGERHAIGSAEVNEYLQQITDGDFTAKDFRTWFGSLHTLMALSELEPYTSITEAKKNIVAAICVAASKLGNTPAICRNSYVHPWILECYLAGAEFRQPVQQADYNETELSAAEQSMLCLLQQRLEARH